MDVCCYIISAERMNHTLIQIKKRTVKNYEKEVVLFVEVIFQPNDGKFSFLNEET